MEGKNVHCRSAIPSIRSDLIEMPDSKQHSSSPSSSTNSCPTNRHEHAKPREPKLGVIRHFGAYTRNHQIGSDICNTAPDSTREDPCSRNGVRNVVRRVGVGESDKCKPRLRRTDAQWKFQIIAVFRLNLTTAVRAALGLPRLSFSHPVICPSLLFRSPGVLWSFSRLLGQTLKLRGCLC